VAYFKLLFRKSPGGTEENHENLNQDSRSPGPRIETGTFRIRSRSVNHSTTTFGSAVLIIVSSDSSFSLDPR
jgi:hypothetical protein